ncbi:MAG TPA: type II 3-dehydroquinate dehydratase [Candidatus Dormibacteraeota bacterium]|nr:type II 3-dehydroquinate dehydratase [Candidatus Dormibacteraeota bacterium]
MKRVVVVNGPNLDLLGKREPHIYGTRSLADLKSTVETKAKALGLEVTFFQSNSEARSSTSFTKRAQARPGS